MRNVRPPSSLRHTRSTCRPAASSITTSGSGTSGNGLGIGCRRYSDCPLTGSRAAANNRQTNGCLSGLQTEPKEQAMDQIRHKVEIKAPQAAVLAKLNTIEGLASWWTAETVGEAGVGGKIEFSFGGPPAAVM